MMSGDKERPREMTLWARGRQWKWTEGCVYPTWVRSWSKAVLPEEGAPGENSIFNFLRPKQQGPRPKAQWNGGLSHFLLFWRHMFFWLSLPRKTWSEQTQLALSCDVWVNHCCISEKKIRPMAFVAGKEKDLEELLSRMLGPGRSSWRCFSHGVSVVFNCVLTHSLCSNLLNYTRCSVCRVSLMFEQ